MLQWLDMGHRYHQWAKSDDGLLWKLHGFHKRNARSLVRALLWPNPHTHTHTEILDCTQKEAQVLDAFPMQKK